MFVATIAAAIASVLCIGLVSSLISTRNSKTTNAEGCGFIRLLTTHFPEPLRLDESERIFALSMLSKHFVFWYAVIRIAIALCGRHALREIILRLDSLKQGVFAFISTRVTLYDRFFVRALTEYEVEQFVILGAGFDSRAYRYADLRRQHDGRRLVSVYEVDLPEVQRDKQSLVRRVVGKSGVGCLIRLLAGRQVLPNNPAEGVHYVSCDFEKENLVDCLLRAGLNPRKKTAVSWEGVTPYLEASAVQQTLQSIARLVYTSSPIKGADPNTPPSTSTSATPCTSRSKGSEEYVEQRDASLLTGLEYHLEGAVSPSTPEAHAITRTDSAPKRVDSAKLHLFVDYVNACHFTPQHAGGKGAQLIRAMAANKTPFKSGLDPDGIDDYMRLNGGFEVLEHWSPTGLTTELLPKWDRALVDSDWAYIVEAFVV